MKPGTTPAGPESGEPDGVFIEPEKVHKLGGVWSGAGDEFTAQAKLIRSTELRPEDFGGSYAHLVSTVSEHVNKLAHTMQNWGERSAWYSENLHSTAAAFTHTDDGNASSLGTNT